MGKKWKQLNLFQRLLFYFTVVIVLPLALVAWIVYDQAANQILDQVESYLDHIVKNTNYQTERFIRDYELASLSLIGDSKVKQFLELNKGQEFEKYTHYREIKKLMNQISIQYDEIELIYIIGDEGQYILSEDRYYRPEDHFPTVKVYQKLSQRTPENGEMVLHADTSLYNANQYVITITRRVRGLSSFQPKGVLGIDVRASSLEELWKLANLSNNTYFWIMDEEGKVVYHPNKEMLGQKIEKNLEESLMSVKQGTFISEWNGEAMLYRFTTSDYSGWKIIAMTPKAEAFEPISGIKRTVIAVGTLALSLAFLLAFLFTRSIVNKSELETKQVQIEKQKIELQALQSQINPHFLHNTLETMNAYAILNEADEISDMAEALSTMFRYSVRNFEVVTMADELQHVQSYLIVQEHRFQKKIAFEVRVAPELLAEEMVKLTLQPLIENAIQHGFRKCSCEGSISLEAIVEEGHLIVRLTDNGFGMTPERLDQIKQRLKTGTTKELKADMGIGVCNVHRRIQLIFGDEYGLELQSEVKEGTIITMKMPRRNLLGERHIVNGSN